MGYETRLGIFRRKIFDQALDDSRSGATEGAGLVVVAVGVQRIDAVFLPHMAVESILCGIHSLEIDQNDNRTPRHIPATDAHLDAFGQQGFLAPAAQQSRTFGEIGCRMFGRPDVRTDKNQMILIFIVEAFCFGRQHSIYSTYFIANLPTCFYNVIFCFLSHN